MLNASFPPDQAAYGSAAVWPFLMSQLRQSPSQCIFSSRFCYFFSLFHSSCVFTCPGENSQDLERERERNGEGEKDDNIVKEGCWSREKPMDQAGGCCQGSTGEVLIRKDEPAVKRSSRMSSRRSLTFLRSLAAFLPAP